MFPYTTARGLQQEKHIQLKKAHGVSLESGQPLAINWKSVGTAIAAGTVALAMLAGSTGHAAGPNDERQPAVTIESDNAPIWQPSTSNESQLSGPNLGPLTAD